MTSTSVSSGAAISTTGATSTAVSSGTATSTVASSATTTIRDFHLFRVGLGFGLRLYDRLLCNFQAGRRGLCRRLHRFNFNLRGLVRLSVPCGTIQARCEFRPAQNRAPCATTEFSLPSCASLALQITAFSRGIHRGHPYSAFKRASPVPAQRSSRSVASLRAPLPSSAQRARHARREPSYKISFAIASVKPARRSWIGCRICTSASAAHPLHSMHPMPADRQPS